MTLLLVTGAGAWWMFRSADAPGPGDVSMAREMGSILESDPVLFAHLTERRDDAVQIPYVIRKVADTGEDLKPFFHSTKEDSAVLKYLVSMRNNFQDIKAVKGAGLELAQDPTAAFAAIQSAFKTLPETYKFEHEDLLDLALEVHIVTHSAETFEQTKTLFEDVIASSLEKVDENDPLGSTTMKAIRNYFLIVEDPEERKRIANIFLREHRSPHVKRELQRLLDTHSPIGPRRPHDENI